MHRRISLTRYLVEKQHNDGRIPPELRLLLEVVARACKRISLAVTKGALGKSWAPQKAKTSRAKYRRSSTSSPTRC
jgi:fructose-1,6-bisphosphatase